MANHGKRAPLARMAISDGILIYSPTTAYPSGDPLRAIAIVGTVTGAEVEPSPVIKGGFRRQAQLRAIDALPLDRVRDHVPTRMLRFGCFELAAADSAAVWKLVPDGPPG